MAIFMQEKTFEWYQGMIDKLLADDAKMETIKWQEYTYNLLMLLKEEIGFEDKAVLDYAMEKSKELRIEAETMVRTTRERDFHDLRWKLYLFEAPYKFESYLLYLEKNRPNSKKFYLPRRKTLKIVVDDLQALEDGEFSFYGLSMPARTGKSTICIFFLSWVMGRHPNKHNAMGGHSGVLAKGFYKEVLNLIITPEYTYSEIFPNVVLESKSAEEYTINLNDPDRFATLTCRGIDGTWTGAVDISSGGYLYVDDLVRDRIESLSPRRLEDKYQSYLNVMVDRKNDGAKELMVGTRWNVLDPLGRIEAQKKNDPRYRFRKIPALNEKDESNFDYQFGVGFSTEYYKELRVRLDKAEWEAKYTQNPFIREGLLFPADEMHYFNGIVPDDYWIAHASCDPAFGGGDSVSMPIVRFKNKDDRTEKKKVIAWVFDNRSVKYTVPKVVDAIIKYGITYVKFEKNNGGLLYCQKVNEELQERGYYHCKCECVSAPNKLPKEEKIKAYSDYIKDNFEFLLPNSYSIPVEEEMEELVFKRDKDYEDAMSEMHMFTSTGKNMHDDAPDGITQAAMMFENLLGGTAEAAKNPLWR